MHMRLFYKRRIEQSDNGASINVLMSSEWVTEPELKGGARPGITGRAILGVDVLLTQACQTFPWM